MVAGFGEVVGPSLFPYLLLLNPADVFRLLTLTGQEGIGTMSGMAGLAEASPFGPGVLLAVLVGWVVFPLGAAVIVFRRKEV